MSHRNVNVPVLSGVRSTRVVFPGMMSPRTPKSGTLKPIVMSSVVSSKVTGSPFLSAIWFGVYEKRRALTLITRGAFCARTPAPPASASSPAASTTRRSIRMSGSHGAFADREARSLVFGLDLAEAKTLVRMRGIPRHGLALRLRHRRGQREDERLRRVVRDVPGHVVVFLVDVAIEHGDVLERHQHLDCLGAVARRPVPLGREVEERPVREHHDARVLGLRREILREPSELLVADARGGIGH